MGDTLQAVAGLFFAAQAKLNMMLAACPTQAERDVVTDKYVALRDNYYDSLNKTFADDDAGVKALVAEAKDVCTELTEIEKQLGDIKKVIDVLTEAVTVGAKIAATV